MFEHLGDRLQGTIKKLRGQSRISEDNIQTALREVRMALIEADVALPVVKDITAAIRETAIGTEVSQKLSPDQAFLKIVQSELVRIMGEENSALDLSTQPPAVILMAGLQGSGKTTSTGKLAHKLIHEKKKVAVVSTDVYRPAAIEQLERLASQTGATFIPSEPTEKPRAIAERALDFAKKQFYDVLIVDTAGRLHIDGEMMEEIKQLHTVLSPVETLFVVDAMTGQDAANTAKAFHEALPLSGVVLAKADGDARGGAALSIRFITGKPIKFLGIGEKTDALEAFHPDRLASRILGMGDVLGMIEDLEQQVDEKKARTLARKIAKGKAFDLEDFREQLAQMQKIDLDNMLGKFPGMNKIPASVKNAHLSPQKLKRQEAIILSMTPAERRRPDIIKGARKRRIAAGCGLDIPEVNRLLKQFREMQKQMKKFKGGKMAGILQRGGNLPMGNLPFK